MKKSTLIASALLIAGTAFTAKAQDPVQEAEVYISGVFNDYTPNGDAQWALTTEIDESTGDAIGTYRGTFDIPAGEFAFNFQFWGYTTLVPGVTVDGEIQVAEENVSVVFDDGFYSGPLAMGPDMSTRSWVYENWGGGTVEVVIDATSADMNVNISVVDAAETPAPGLYIAGAWNEFAPEGDEIWQLNATDQEGVFRGTFEIPANQFEFYLQYENFTLVPGVNEDGEPVAAEQDVTALNEDDFFTGMFASTGTPNFKWINTTWEGGWVEVTVDFNSFDIVMSVLSEEDVNVGPEALYIAGNFNDYDPQEDSIWALNKTGKLGMYRGTFNLEGGFQFNILCDGPVLVPGVEEDGEYVADLMNVTVLDGDDHFSGYFASTSMARTYWVNDAWESGDVEVTVDLNTNEIVVSAVAESVVPEGPDALYIAGEFNEYNPEEDGIWALNRTEGEGVYRGTFNIPAGQFSFHIQYDSIDLVPGVEDEDGETIASTADAEVVFDEGFFTGALASTGMSASNWVNSTWEGGNVEVTVDLINNSIVLDANVEQGGTEGPESLFIAGAFNEYDPQGLEIWALTKTDAEGVYRGTFNIAADQFSFHIQYDSFDLVPATVDEDGETIANTSDEEVVFDDDFYAGTFATTGMSHTNWVNTTWEGGDVEITVDLNEGSIVMSTAVEGENVGPEALYIAGAFNDYNPEGLEIWALGKEGDAEGVYRGTFTIPARKFSFNLVGDMMTFVPGIEDEDGNLTFSETNVEVLDNDTFYSGMFASTSVARTYWVNDDWAGGDVEITVDFNENTILISSDVAGEGEGPEALYIAGAFNDYDPDGLEIWALGKEGDAEGVYRGTFEIPAEKFSFYLVGDMISLVPGLEDEDGNLTFSETDVEVLDNDTFYSGPFASTSMAKAYWVNSDWEGGYVEITVDFNEGTIMIDSEVEGGEEADVWYIRGAFNDYDPAGLEIWALTAVEGENGVYAGTFTIPEEQFAINFLSPQGIVFVPAALANTEVVFTDDVYTGNIDYAADETEEAYSFTFADWAGGPVKVVLDANEGTVTLTDVEKVYVKTINLEDANNVIFNLNGVRVRNNNNLDKGIYIVNGKKLVVK